MQSQRKFIQTRSQTNKIIIQKNVYPGTDPRNC